MNEIHRPTAPVILVLFISMLLISACHLMDTNNMSSLQVVEYVDLERYSGKWYEIARYPHKFQEGCVGTQATYTLIGDRLSVLNECYEESQPGKVRSAKGRAWVVDRETNAKLKVSFFWPFSGDYWIIDLGDNYEYAVVGHPKRKYLWILSRTRELRDTSYERILNRLENQGYDTSKLLKTGNE